MCRIPSRAFLVFLPLVTALLAHSIAPSQSSGHRKKDSNTGNPSQAVEQQFTSKIVSLERKLWDADVTGDSAPYHDLIAPDFEGIKHGLRFSSQEDGLASKEYKLRSYTMSDERVRLIRSDIALLTYRCTWSGTFVGTQLPERPFYIASIWVNEAGHWKNIFYAETQPDFATEAYQKLTTGVPKAR